MEQLVVRLGSQLTDPVHWLVWSTSEQEIIASGEITDGSQLSSLAERAGGRSITALVPGCDFNLKWVQLPAKGGRKALAAIPYMLEDELSSDIGELFFALGDKHDDQQAVAVVERAKMQSWLDWMQEAGLFCNKLLPDILALPHHDQAWTLLSLGDDVLIRQDAWQGMQGHRDWILAAVEHFAKRQTEGLAIANHSEVDLSQVAHVEVLEQSLEMPMQLLATGALHSNFNLLQGDFKPKRQSSTKWSQWRLAAILAGLALLTSLVDKGLELNRLSSQKDQLQAQIEAEYKRAFPDTTRIVNVRSQMRQKLAGLEQGGGGVSMLVVMSQLSDAFAASDVKPQTLRFDSKRSELRMQAVANNFEALEQFKRLAEEKGFEVQQGAINNRDNQVIGSLSIRS